MSNHAEAHPDDSANPTPPTWAVVHLMGHAKYAGRLTEEEKFGVKLGRVDVPAADGFTTVYFGGGSVYKIEVVSEEVARHVGRQTMPAPVSPWDFPKPALAAADHFDPEPAEDELERQRRYDPDEDDEFDQNDDCP
jgi:hypothetical protein